MEQPLWCSISPRTIRSARQLHSWSRQTCDQCGIQLEILSQPAEQYLAAGPDGPVFGRQFDLAQFAWMTAVEPPCSLYLTNEIPGPYPDYPKGWGGVNASGYSNAQYDQACLDALYSLADHASAC